MSGLFLFLLPENIVTNYNELMQTRDRRVDQWPLMSSPLPTLLICTAYIYFVKSLGPKLMKDRPPFQLKSLIIIYNAFQVAFSAWIVYKMLKHGWWLKYNYVCQPCDFSDDADAIAMANIVWWYFFGKFTEFLDTIFFVLRKKRDQISALHVIHHCLVPVICWWGLRFSPGGHGTLYAMINSMIHVMMYTYYMLSAMGPQLQKYLWWKKYLTTMQLVQFTIALFHGALGLTNGCDFRKSVLYIQCANALMFFGLFSNFYLQAYIKRRRLPNASSAVPVAGAVNDNDDLPATRNNNAMKNGKTQ